ncbi:MAG: class I SAM-dependent methyltransferase [Acidobacteriota bacterium]|nr:class I SAM-dependent methyltransferase [Acidobacteriota bacterium]
MSSVLGKLRWSLHHRGFSGTLNAAVKSLCRKIQPAAAPQTHPFDLENGTDTGGLIAGADLASGHASDLHIAGYAAVPPSRFRNIVGRWQVSNPPHPLADYTFVDIGCGKGRALLLSAEYGFREVVGVELNPSLAAIARSNADLWSTAGKARSPIRVEQADAAELSFPPSPCVVFLFNPFGLELMRHLASRMAADFHNREDDLEVLYYKPEQAAAFADSFHMIWCEATAISREDLAADPAADPRDETRAYRLRRRSTS